MRREVASLPSTEGSLFRSEGRVKKEKKARSGKCNWQSAFVFRMSKHWNYLSRVLPTGGGGGGGVPERVGKGFCHIGLVGYTALPPHISGAYGTGRQNVCV